MKKCLVYALIASIASGSAVPVAFGQKSYNEQWTAHYVTDSKNEDFKKMAGEAKCNICHIEGASKKERNPYGKEAAVIFKEAGINKDSPKKDMAGFKKSIVEAFKKLEEVKAGDGKTFGEKIRAGELPGGNTEGK